MCWDKRTAWYLADEIGFQCRTRHNVCWDDAVNKLPVDFCGFQCRTQHCVCWDTIGALAMFAYYLFQCRTRHYMCWDETNQCVPRQHHRFNAARSIMCVGTRLLRRLRFLSIVSMPHAALCVLGQSQESSYFRIPSFNAARSMMCVGALSSPALVPRGLRRRFGKSSIFRAVFAVKMRFSDERARGRSSLFLIRCGLRRFGKTQRRNVAYASLWIIFHFTSITK